MNLANLGSNLLQLADAVAPLIGLADEVEAGKKVVAAIEGLITDSRDTISSADHAALAERLETLSAKVNAHADAVQARLRG